MSFPIPKRARVLKPSPSKRARKKMAASSLLSGIQSFSHFHTGSSPKSVSSFSSSLPSSLALLRRAGSLRSFPSSATHRRSGRRPSAAAAPFVISAALGKLAETELVPVPKGPEGLDGKFPAAAGVYGVYNGDGSLHRRI